MQFQHKRCCSWARFEYLVYPLTRLNVAVIAHTFSHQFDDFRPWGFCRFPISQPSLMKPEGIYICLFTTQHVPLKCRPWWDGDRLRLGRSLHSCQVGWSGLGVWGHLKISPRHGVLKHGKLGNLGGLMAKIIELTWPVWGIFRLEKCVMKPEATYIQFLIMFLSIFLIFSSYILTLFSPTAECFGVFSHSKGFGADRSSSKTDSPKVPRFPSKGSQGSQLKVPK